LIEARSKVEEKRGSDARSCFFDQPMQSVFPQLIVFLRADGEIAVGGAKCLIGGVATDAPILTASDPVIAEILAGLKCGDRYRRCEH